MAPDVASSTCRARGQTHGRVTVDPGSFTSFAYAEKQWRGSLRRCDARECVTPDKRRPPAWLTRGFQPRRCSPSGTRLPAERLSVPLSLCLFLESLLPFREGVAILGALLQGDLMQNNPAFSREGRSLGKNLFCPYRPVNLISRYGRRLLPVYY